MDPVAIERAMQLAIEHHSADRLREAEQIYREVLRANPNHPGALHLLGLIAHRAGHNDQAIELIRRAIQILPNYADAYANLGKILCDKGEAALALDCCERAIAIKPTYAPAHNVLGIALNLLNRRAEAAAAFRRAVEIDPNYADAILNLGDSATEAGEHDDAEQYYRRALAIRPNDYKAHFELAYVLKEKGRLDDALAMYRAAMAMRPQSRSPHSNLIYTMHFHPRFDPQTIRAEQRRWYEQHAQRFSPPAHRNSRDPDRRLKIGYVSPHFANHAESFFVLPLLENHDRTQFEVHCYSSMTPPDEVTARMQKSADVWHDVATISDDALAEKIRADGIDVLIDLTMHMAGERLIVFAQKPAPVQVAWLAYPGSTGQPFMDYRLTDASIDPPDADDSWSTERAVRLPDSWVCYDPLCELPPVSPTPALANGFITFGSLNNFCKHNDEVLSLWARLLNEVENSCLILMCPRGQSRDRVREFFQARGIDSSRVEFIYYLPRAEYLKFHERIDIALDPFPYNGITTTCDALVMGVPVFTIDGDRPQARAGAGILYAADLNDFVAASQNPFTRMVKQFSADAAHLNKIRQGLRKQFQTSSVMNASRFARSVEHEYRQMWRDWCRS